MQSLFIAVLLILHFTSSYAQRSSISGRLINWESKKPVTVAPIIVSGTTIKVYTDHEGNFRIPPLDISPLGLVVQLVIEGQTFVTTGLKANDNNYYSVVLTGLTLTQAQPQLNLGDVYTATLDNKTALTDLPDLSTGNRNYHYQLTKDRNNTAYLWVDFTEKKQKPANK
jgi:hypothetical protein